MNVSNSARIAAAKQLLGEAENKIYAAQRILEYADTQQEETYTPTRAYTPAIEWDQPIDGIYPGQKPNIKDEEDSEECES